MTTSKLKKQLLKDIQKSPGKAAALGVLTLVALYAWAPLLLKSGSSNAGKRNKASTAAVSAETSGIGAQADAPPLTGKPAATPWDEVVKQIEADPLMKSIPRGLAVSNPFCRDNHLDKLLSVESPPEKEAPLPAAKKAIPAPDVTVSSTVVGVQRRVAVIDGRPYAEGRRIQLASGQSITLTKVGERHVVIEQEGQQFTIAVRDEHAMASRKTP